MTEKKQAAGRPEIKPPRVVKSEYVVRRGPWMTVRCDRLELPDGRIVPEHYVIEYPDWVNVIAVTPDNRYVMVRQYRHGLGQIQNELCAGMMEPDETPLEAAKRELLEETGFGGGEWEEICTISGNPSTTNNLTHCFVAHGVEPTASRRLDATEDLSAFLISEQELLQLMESDEMKQSLMLAPLWKYFYMKSRK